MYFDSKAYAERIRSLRMNKGLTQAQLAEKIGISASYLAKIENDRQSGSVDLAIDIAEFFDVSLDYLLRGETTSSQNLKKIVRKIINYLSAVEKKL